LIRLSGERAMPKPYSIDLRGRVVEEVESGASIGKTTLRFPRRARNSTDRNASTKPANMMAPERLIES
jgi:hypothetical protein